jgi:hypothetical protein
MTPEERDSYNAYMRDHMRKKHQDNPWYSSFCNRSSWACRNGIEFTLTLEEVAESWRRGCALTGIPFKRGVGKMCRGSATLDRIVPSRGYVSDNCLFVRSDVNCAKGSGSYKDLDYMTSVLVGQRSVVDVEFLPMTPEKCGDLLKTAQRRSRLKGVDCTITREFIREQYSKQSGRCAVTGIPFGPVRVKGDPDFFSCSIDKIDPSAGYKKDNVRFVLWSYNSLKGEDSDSDALDTARHIQNFGAIQRLSEYC